MTKLVNVHSNGLLINYHDYQLPRNMNYKFNYKNIVKQ